MKGLHAGARGSQFLKRSRFPELILVKVTRSGVTHKI